MVNRADEPLDSTLQIRLTAKDRRDFEIEAGNIGLKPGPMLRHLVVSWLAARRAQAPPPSTPPPTPEGIEGTEATGAWRP